MSAFSITGPGAYRTRDGRNVVITHLITDGSTPFKARADDDRFATPGWALNGSYYDEEEPNDKDIVGVWDNSSQQQAPQPQQKWRHHSGRVYTVLFLTNNEGETQRREYPVTVVYQGENGRRWSGPLSDWHRRMTLIEVVK